MGTVDRRHNIGTLRQFSHGSKNQSNDGQSNCVGRGFHGPGGRGGYYPHTGGRGGGNHNHVLPEFNHGSMSHSSKQEIHNQSNNVVHNNCVQISTDERGMKRKHNVNDKSAMHKTRHQFKNGYRENFSNRSWEPVMDGPPYIAGNWHQNGGRGVGSGRCVGSGRSAGSGRSTGSGRGAGSGRGGDFGQQGRGDFSQGAGKGHEFPHGRGGGGRFSRGRSYGRGRF